MQQRFAKKFYILTGFLIAVYFYAYRQWLFSTSILTSGDWQYYFRDTLATVRIQYFSIWFSDSSFGRVLIDSGQAPTYALYGLLAKYFGANYNVAERVISMIPIIIVTPLATYVLAQYLFRNRLASLTAAIVYSCNTYILTLQTGDLTLAGPYAVAPLILFFYIKLLESFSLKKVVLSGLLLAVSTAYEPRGTYVTMIVIGLYVICKIFNEILKKAHIKKLLQIILVSVLPVLLLGLLNLFWILALSRTSNPNGTVLGEGLFGSQYFKLANALTLFQPYWSGGKPIAFVVHQIPFYFWLIPIISFSSLFLFRKNKFILFFGLVSFCGLFLAKQADNPFNNLYGWFYVHIPGFNAFREASKFYAVIALSYAMLIAGLVSELKGYRIKYFHYKLANVVSVTVIILFFVNIIPLLNGKIGTLFVDRHVPTAEQKVNNYINNQPEYFRTLWMPTTTRWIDYNNIHPAESLTGIVNGPWSQLIGYKQNSITPPTNQQLVKIFNTNYIYHLLNASSIKYIIIPSRDIMNDNDFFIHFGNDRQYFVDVLNNMHGLKHVNIGVSGIDVYENTAYAQYAYAATSITHISSYDQLEANYNFLENISPTGDNFTTSSNATGSNILNSVFSNVSSGDISKGSLKSTSNIFSGANLYSNINAQQISYKYDSGEVTIYSKKNNNLNSPGKTNVINSDSQVVDQIILPSGSSDYAISDGMNIVNLDNNNHDRTFDKTPENIKIVKKTSTNLITNPSLEDGLWQNKVSDCNKFDNNALIGQSLSEDHTSGKSSLQLTATNHTACTSPSLINLTTNMFWLKFDYKVYRGKQAGYEIRFNDPSQSVQKYYLPTSDGDWTELSKLISVPEGATTAQLILEAFPNDSSPYRSIVRYDNLSAVDLDSIYSKNIGNQDIFEQSKSKVSQPLIYSDSSISGNNIIPNPSLEDGLWQNKVSDCNAHDNNPSISMSIGKDKQNSKNYIELSAKRHIACTGPNSFSVKEGQDYSFNFKYQSGNAKYAGYSLKFNDKSRTLISDNQLAIKGKDWNNFSNIIHVPFGATTVQLTIYAYSDESTGLVNYVNRYQDFSFKLIPNIQSNFYIFKKEIDNNVLPSKVSTKQISPTQKLINIKSASTSFYLIMSESFNSGWELKFNKNLDTQNLSKDKQSMDEINNQDHYEMNGFENGWYVNLSEVCKVQGVCSKNADGTYNLSFTAQFLPQHYFNVGLFISGSTAVLCIVYLGTSYIRGRNKNNIPEYHDTVTTKSELSMSKLRKEMRMTNKKTLTNSGQKR